MLVPSDYQAKYNLEDAANKHNELKLHAQSLNSVNSELGSLGASLIQASAIEHVKLMESINEYLTSFHYLHNCLINIYFHKKSDETINQWKASFIEANKTIFKLFNSRKKKHEHCVSPLGSNSDGLLRLGDCITPLCRPGRSLAHQPFTSDRRLRRFVGRAQRQVRSNCCISNADH